MTDTPRVSRVRKRSCRGSSSPTSPVSYPSPTKRKVQHEQEKFVVQAILDDRVVDGVTEFLLLWQGYPRSDASWTSNTDCPELVSAYFRSKVATALAPPPPPPGPAAPRPARL